MAAYRVTIKPPAEKEIDSLGSKRDRQRIVSRIQALPEDPRPRGCDKLAGRADNYRVRQGRYRIVYTIDHALAEIVVVKVGQRREVYR